MIISERVGERMRALGLSQSELARRVGVAQPTIYKLLKTSKKGSAHLHKIARELGTTPAYLSGEVDTPDEGADLGQRLSSDEQEWLEMYAGLSDEQRKAIRTIVRGIFSAPDVSLHARNERNKRDGYSS